MRIDTNKIFKKYSAQENYRTTYRDFVNKEILSAIHIEALKHTYTNIIVGVEILDYLVDSNMFHYNGFDNPNINTVERIGSLYGLSIYKDNTYHIKDDEVLFFDKIKNLSFIKKFIRNQKINRLKE